MKRVLTAVVGILLILAVTAWGPVWLFVLLVSAVAALSLDEFLHMVGQGGLHGPGRWILLPAVGVTLAFAVDVGWVVWALVANLFLLGAAWVASGRAGAHLEYVAFGSAGLLYACLLPGFVILLSPQGFWVLVATVWAGDTAAYYGGRLMGRHRLAPVISPNKTIEGAIAGLTASIAAGTVAGVTLLEAPVPWLMAIACFSGMAGQMGDLFESAMKRTVGIKDSSNRLPGHGGVLDRVDSLLFAAPVFHFFLMWVV